jgi:hypothetical protein
VNCQALINKFLLDYHENKLSKIRRGEFELHLKLCKDCRNYVASYKKTIELAKATENLTPDPPPQQLVDAIMKITQSQHSA